MSKKRSIEEEHLAKEYNLKRHYDTNHKTNYDQYVAKLREDKLSKPFTEGEFISECLIKAPEVLCPAQIKKFKSGSLSRNTVTSRIDEIAENLRNQHNTTISTFQAYSIAIDESTDIRNIAQLAVFIRGCDVNLKISEELLEIIPMHNTTTGADIFDALMEVLKKYKLPLEKFVCLATDGAPTMTGITKGVVARLKETCKQHVLKEKTESITEDLRERLRFLIQLVLEHRVFYQLQDERWFKRGRVGPRSCENDSE
ncbi:PREDICTED: general transcription factor II-I repeat domain-containing protein 2-like [Dufourea novaeangliae]|uniref:general transcription factor II-I repeat domain-containing protein 2-like n=1 Tax=Dufourea novaeangliae TaxID=178035 RepID=UPI00076736A5|nr:PREDICTED: general transcription factor II-I repeat domain-containing protein 2-like [Dufourea novaeangliae]